MVERGAIYFVQPPSDPHKRPVPVVVVSIDSRNRYGEDVLVIPFSTSPKKYHTHLDLSAGETGLPANSIAKCENIHVLDKSLFAGKQPASPRRLSEARMRQMAELVGVAMGMKR